MKIKPDKVGNPGYYFDEKEKSEIVQALFERVDTCNNAIAEIEKAIAEVPPGVERDDYALTQERIIKSFHASVNVCERLAQEMED